MPLFRMRLQSADNNIFHLLISDCSRIADAAEIDRHF